MNRVLFVTMHFPPSRDIGARACAQIARHLRAHNWSAVVLTRKKQLIDSPNSSSRNAFDGTIVEAGMLPHPLSIYRRIKRMLQRTAVNSTESAYTQADEPGSFRRWVLSCLVMPDAFTGWILPAVIQGLRAIRRERIRHIISSAPYWTNHLVAMILARWTGLPWTAHYRDPWTQIPQAKPVSRLSLKVEKWLERLVVEHADSVVCVTEAHTSLLRQMYKHVAPEKFITIPNGFDGEEWDCCSRVAGDEERFVITYAGSFMMGHRTPRPLFRALRQLIETGRIDPARVRLQFFGDCAVAEGLPVKTIAAEYRLDSIVTIEPPVERQETLQRMLGANLLLLLAEGWTLQVPGKTYEYLRAARPVLALTGEGALADLLRRTGGAWVVDPDDNDGICRALLDAYEAWRADAPSMQPDERIVAAFDRRILAGQFAALFAQHPAPDRGLTLQVSH